jgi:hypothetical protein
VDYLAIAANAARSQAQRFDVEALAPSITSTEVVLDSLTISADVMPGHYVANAVLLDLQPSQMVAALVAVEAAIREQYRLAVRTGWRACSDSILVHFYSW